MADYEKKVRKVLSENGYSLKRRGKGDHDIWYNPVLRKSISVDGVIKSRHSANELMKEAGIKHKF